jgi:hypothetical protein
MARPKKQAGQSRANILRIRLTPEERAELDFAAQNKALETSSWARSELLTLARSVAQTQQRGLEIPGAAR